MKAKSYQHRTPLAGSVAGSVLFWMYGHRPRYLRGLIRELVCRLEGGEVYSRTLRRIFLHYHHVDIGLYTHGGCFMVGSMDPYTTIGRYSSIAKGAKTLTGNHPMDFKSTHGLFYAAELGFCKRNVDFCHPLSVGNDVWLGANSLILPHVHRIGDGAVVGAGAVVNKDVPPYAVVTGHPARVVRFRFPPKVIEQLLVSRWWDKPIEELDPNEFTRPYYQTNTVSLATDAPANRAA